MKYPNRQTGRLQPGRVWQADETEAERDISALLVRRRQLEEMLKVEKSRLQTVPPKMRGSVERIVERMIETLKEEIKRLEKDLDDFMNENEEWQAQYQELLRGKVKKVALTACMRKFLTILNAMMRDKVPS